MTSGPGTTNLATGLVTATTEQDAMTAICGAVARADRLKRTHQSMDAIAASRARRATRVSIHEIRLD